MKLNHVGIILLSFISLFGLYDIIGVDVWVAVMIGYLFTYFPASLLLFLMSYSSIKKDERWLKKIGMLGILIGVSSISITLLYFIWNLIK